MVRADNGGRIVNITSTVGSTEAVPGRVREPGGDRQAGRPGNTAQAVAFLVSHEAGYVTSKTLFVDGGDSADKLKVRS